MNRREELVEKALAAMEGVERDHWELPNRWPRDACEAIVDAVTADDFAQLLLDRIDPATELTQAVGVATIQATEAILGLEGHSVDYWEGWESGYKDGVRAFSQGIKNAAEIHLGDKARP